MCERPDDTKAVTTVQKYRKEGARMRKRSRELLSKERNRSQKDWRGYGPRAKPQQSDVESQKQLLDLLRDAGHVELCALLERESQAQRTIAERVMNRQPIPRIMRAKLHRIQAQVDQEAERIDHEGTSHT